MPVKRGKSKDPKSGKCGIRPGQDIQYQIMVLGANAVGSARK